MNNFKTNLTGLIGVVKARIFYKKNAKEAQRTVTVVSGPGTQPDDDIDRSKPYFGHGHQIAVRLADGSKETISAFDLEYILVDGKKIRPIDPIFKDFDVAAAPTVEVKSAKPRGREPWKESQA